MAHRFQFQMMSLAIALIFLLSSTALGLLGGYSKADPKDPEVVKNGNFAVEEHNKKNHTDLVYKTVIEAERQVVAGYNYKLLIKAADKGVAHRYNAVVYERWNGTQYLTSFEQVDRKN